jgi:copper chaperone CopZ
MKRISSIASLFAVALLLIAATAFAGGHACMSNESSSAKAAGAGGHCSGSSDAASMAKACDLKAGESIYSFAVPGVECDHCINSIQTALMAQKGVRCAHVDLTTRTAYIIADHSVNKKAVAKTIQTAGFKNKFKGEGSKVQAEFAKAMTAGDKGINSCQRKEKDKV